MDIIKRTELTDKNLVKAINTKVIPVVAYPTNVCKFTKSEPAELDLVIKRDLRKTKILGQEAVHEKKRWGKWT